MLRTVYIKVIAVIQLEGVLQETVIVLPNVMTFSLVMTVDLITDSQLTYRALLPGTHRSHTRCVSPA